MSTYRIPILGWATSPDNEDVYLEPYNIKATNDQWKRLIWVINDGSTRVGLHGGFTVPKNYVDNGKIIVVWTTTATTGDVEWDCDYRAVGGDDAESLDQSGTQESVNVNDTAPSAAHERMETSLPLTASNLAADDEVEFYLARDRADAGDTISTAVIIFNVLFEYTDV